MSEKLQYVGNPNSKAADGIEKVLGAAKYIGDMTLPGMLYAKLLTSPVPHAKIVELDVKPALAV